MSKLSAYGRIIPMATTTFKGEAVVAGSKLPQGSISIIGSLAAEGIVPFFPTYNGAQSPTIVGDSIADYLDFDPNDSAFAQAITEMKIYVRKTATDTEIWMDGFETGTGTDLGSGEEPLTKIFDLNEVVDEVKIFLVSPVFQQSGGNGFGLVIQNQTQIGSFTDSSFFTPTQGVDYGWDFDTASESQDPPGPGDKWGIQIPIIAFTFRKAGFTDLTVTYKVRNQAYAEAEGFPF